MNKAIWVSWERHRRSRSLSEELSIPIFEIVHSGYRVNRYIKSIFETYNLINNENPDVIFFQNPSIVLSLFLVLMRPFHKSLLIMDAHNAGVYPMEGKCKPLQKVAIWLIRKVDSVIVTNMHLSSVVSSMGGKAIVLSDPIPKMTKESRVDERPKNYILFVCTWAEDEPYMEVFSAMEKLSGLNVDLRVTGNPPPDIISSNLPENVILEGFVTDEKYESLIKNCKLVLDLTTRSNCLVCGAYEAVSVGRPGILSNDEATKRLFSSGFVFTENNADDIARSIKSVVSDIDNLEVGVIEFRSKYSSFIKNEVDGLKRNFKI